jgi:hypothetical protein
VRSKNVCGTRRSAHCDRATATFCSGCIRAWRAQHGQLHKRRASLRAGSEYRGSWPHRRQDKNGRVRFGFFDSFFSPPLNDWFPQAECAVAAAFNEFVFAGSIGVTDKPAGCHHSFETDGAGGYKWKKGAYSWNPNSAADSNPNELAAPVCAQLTTDDLCSGDGDFVRGDKGASTCPSGTSVIDTPEECAWAAKSLGLIPAGSTLNGTNAGLAFKTEKGTASRNPHPGCSYNVNLAVGANADNEKIINFNSNLSPLADLSGGVAPLCRCNTPATDSGVSTSPPRQGGTDSPITGATGSSPLAPPGTSAKKKNKWTVIVIVVVLCIAGIVFGVVWYRKNTAGENTDDMNEAFSML